MMTAAKNITHIGVIGDGGWGTTLAVYLAGKGYAVHLWGPFPPYVQQMRESRYNPKFLPGIRLPEDIDITGQLTAAVEKSQLIIFAIPSPYAVDVLRKIKRLAVSFDNKIILSVTKGIIHQNLKRISEVIEEILGEVNLAVLSGPTIAREVAQGIPSTAVIAARRLSIAQKLQKIFNSENFRIYTNTDVIGVELGGSLKNIIALACGVCDGLNLGTNTKAAILTRGLAEMARLGQAMGAQQRTFAGLSGLGDLVTTCFSPQSRNRSVGEQLGRGRPVQKILTAMEMVAEGVVTVKAAHRLSSKYKVAMPITQEVYNIIYRKKNSRQAVADLMTRRMTAE